MLIVVLWSLTKRNLIYKCRCSLFPKMVIVILAYVENIFLANQFFSSIFLYRIYILYLPSYMKDEMFGLIEISETDGKNNNTKERKK